MRKMIVALALVLMLAMALSCQVALAWDYPVTVEGFPYTAETLNVEAPPIPDYTVEVVNGELLMDIWWDVHNFGQISASYFDANGVEYEMRYYTREDRFRIENPPVGFHPDAPEGSFEISWSFGTEEDKYSRDHYYVWVSAATGAYERATKTEADEKGSYTFKFDASGRVTSYAYSGKRDGVRGEWSIAYAADGTAKVLGGEYTVTFPDGVVGRFDHLGEAKSITWYDQEGASFTWKEEQGAWVSGSGDAAQNAPANADGYAAPYADEADWRIFATLEDAGIDLDAVRADIPKLADLNYTVENGEIEVQIGEKNITSFEIHFADGTPSTGYGGGRSRASIKLEGRKKEDVTSVTYTYSSGYGYSATVNLADDENVRRIELDSGYSDDFLFDTVRVNYENQTVFLRHDKVSADYDMDGKLVEYRYIAEPGLEVIFNPAGNLISYSRSNGKDYDWDYLAQYLPLEISGLATTTAEAPNIKMYATLAAAGIDPEICLSKTPAFTGMTMDENFVVTVEDHGYEDVYFCDWSSEDYKAQGVLTDGVWTMECAKWDWSNTEAERSLYIDIVDEQGNKIRGSWIYPGDFVFMFIGFAEPLDNGVASFRIEYPSNAMMAVSETSIALYFDGAYAFYNEDGALTSYSYNALDGANVYFNADGVRTSLYGGDESGQTVYPPLEIVE